MHGVPTRNSDGMLAGFSLPALMAVFRRRKWLFLAVTLIVGAGFAAAAFLLPPRYRAAALVEARPLDPTGLQPDPPELEVGRELARIEEILHRPSILEGVVQAFDLFPEATGRVTEKELDEVRQRIRVRATGPRAFTIGFEDGDRRRVAKVAAHLAGVLIETTAREQENRAQARSRFLADQVPAVEAELADQKAALEEYRRRWVHEGPEQVESTRKLLEGLQERLQQIAAGITENEARRTAIEREMLDLERGGVPGDAAPSPAQSRLEEARLELERLRSRYTDRHPEVVRAEARLAELTAAADSGEATAPQPAYTPVRLRYVQLGAELEAVRERLSRDHAERAALLQQAASYERRIEAAPGHEATLAAMAQDHQATRTRHEELVGRVHEAQLAERLQKTTEGAQFHLVEAPRIPDSSEAPRRLRLVLMGLLAALGLGLGAALLAEQGDTSFRDPEGLTAALGLPVLATLPFVATGGGRDPGRRDARVVAMLDDPNGPLAEQYRILATKVLRQSQRRGSGMVLVTSPTGGEGKTTTAVNLALALSHLRGDRVLLVDTDLGRPAVHLLLGTYLDNGLAKLLAHPEDDPRGYVRHVHGLSVLQTGPFAQEVRAALASSRAQRAFRRLRQSYELVVVDSPPVLAVAEGLILERLVDSVLLVVRASSTPRQVVRRTVESLDPEKMIGAVLNAADTAVAPAYPYRYYEPEARSAVGGGGARP